MTQEEKELLLKDLCARLLYVTYYDLSYYGHKTRAVVQGFSPSADPLQSLVKVNTVFDFIPYENIKPYLRSMSSMTKEERDELKEICADYLDEWENAETVADKWKLDAKTNSLRSAFYNSHHLDWNGLIDRGLASEAPEGMYNNV